MNDIISFNQGTKRYTLTSWDVVKIEERSLHNPSEIITTFTDFEDLEKAVKKLRKYKKAQ